MSVDAADQEFGPLGGMFPPYQERQDCDESISRDDGPLMYPRPLSQMNAADGEPI